MTPAPDAGRPSSLRMRTPAIVLALAILCASSAFAQGIGKGVRGGLNVATTTTSGDNGDAAPDWLLRGVVGGFIVWPVTSWLVLQPEVLYAMKGAKQEEFGLESKLLLDYIEVPVLARVSRGSPGTRTWYLTAGPAFGWLARAKARADFGGATEEIDLKDDVKSYDIGLAAGGGVEFGSILVDARYTHGLSDIDKDTSDDVKVRNRAVSLTVGFRF